MDQDTSFFEEFMPHGMCYLWRTDILLLHVISDALIAISYFFIPVALFYFFKERRDFPFRKVILMFSLFIFTCGLTHAMGIWTVWHGTYGLQGLVKSATAAASIATAIMLIPVLPQLLALRSPNELEAANLALTHEVAERQKSERQMRQFVEAAPDATLIVNTDGIIQFVNAQVENLFGYAREALVGNSVNLLLPGTPGRENSSSAISRFLKNPSQRGMETDHDLAGLKNDGNEFPIEVSLSAVGTDDEPLVSASIRDITERRKTEAQTKRLEREIAHVGRLNTMGQMAAGLAHELNQPLTAMTQNADAALSMASKQADINPSLLETLKDLEEQAHRAGEIIRALRQFVSKDDAARSTFDFAELVSQTVRLVDAEAKAKGVLIKTELSDLPPYLGGRIQIAQVFVNLLHNAIAATAADDLREKRITIAAQNQDGSIYVSVSDTGTGLTTDLDVMMPFQSTKPEGMGMGLSIARTIVEAHEGRFWVDHSYTEGAKFCFTLPLQAEQSNE